MHCFELKVDAELLQARMKIETEDEEDLRKLKSNIGRDVYSTVYCSVNKARVEKNSSALASLQMVYELDLTIELQPGLLKKTMSTLMRRCLY